jgi:uncharacterized protein (TIGR03435 family)
MREVKIAIGMAGLFLFASNAARGQAAAKLEFEVASVKPMPPSSPQFPEPAGGPGTTDPGQITWSGVPLKWLLKTAYDVRLYQVSGPAWLDSGRYMIVAKVPEGATKGQVHLMWQNLLETRFGVVVHHESKVFQSDVMTLAKGASKLKETGFYGPDDLLDRYMTTPGLQVAGDGGNRHLLARAQTLEQVASLLDAAAGHPVIDKTGLTGKYDFDVEFDLSQPPAPGDNANRPNPNGTFAPCISCVIQSALQQDLGLKFMKSTITLDVIVVDHAEKIPTDN